MSGEFCDTNVLVYAYDLSAGAKHRQALTLVEGLWRAGSGVISIQVLQELYVTLTRPRAPLIDSAKARVVVDGLTAWRVIVPDPFDVVAAIDASFRWHLSFWDAMIVVAASKAGSTVLWTEDLNDGQSYDGVMVRNPFKPAGGP